MPFWRKKNLAVVLIIKLDQEGGSRGRRTGRFEVGSGGLAWVLGEFQRAEGPNRGFDVLQMCSTPKK